MNTNTANSSERLTTERLELRAMTRDTAACAVGDRAALSRLLDAAIPNDWPPEHIDEQSIGYMAKLMADDSHAGWWLWFVIVREGQLPGAAETGRVLVGTAGYKGPADAEGAIEVGYSVVDSQQRRGYATEAVARLIARAWEYPEVTTILGETLPHLTPSIRVMEKLGFKFIGEGSEAGVIRFAIPRA